MEWSAIGDFVSSVGFPVACCIFLFVQNSKMQTTLVKFQETLRDIAEEIKELRSNINK